MRIWKPIAFGTSGAAIAFALSLAIPDRYVSQALLRVETWGCTSTESGETISTGFERARQEVLSDSSLSEILRRRDPVLYAKERKRLALPDLIRKIRADTKVEPSKEPGRDDGTMDILISFSCSAPQDAKAVVAAFVTKLLDALSGELRLRHGEMQVEDRRCPTLDMLEPISVAQTPAAPKRYALTLAGALAGLLVWRYWPSS